jgi:hypothetical protein
MLVEGEVSDLNTAENQERSYPGQRNLGAQKHRQFVQSREDSHNEPYPHMEAEKGQRSNEDPHSHGHSQTSGRIMFVDQAVEEIAKSTFPGKASELANPGRHCVFFADQEVPLSTPDKAL